MQLALFTPEPKPLPKNFQGFLNFYREHRNVFEEFVRRSKAIKRTHEHYGARTIMEVTRYHTHLGGETDFKINNNHIPYMSRLAMLRYPSLKGLFELRPERYDATDQQLLSECKQIDQELNATEHQRP